MAVYMRSTGARLEHARCIEESAAIREELGNPLGLASSLDDRALSSSFRGNAEETIVFARQSRKILLKLGDPGSIARGAENMGFYSLFSGHFDEALESYEEAIIIYEKLGALVSKLSSTVFQAYTNLHIGDYELANLQAHQFFDDNPQLNMGFIEGIGYNVLGCSALVVADYEEALDRCHQAVECFREIPTAPSWLTLSLTAYTIAVELGGDKAAAKRHLLEVLQIAARVKLPNVFLLILPPAALLVADIGEVEKAIELFEVARQLPFVANSQWYEDVVGKRIDKMATGLSPEVVDAARQSGKERDPGETAKELLAELEAEQESESAS